MVFNATFNNISVISWEVICNHNANKLHMFRKCGVYFFFILFVPDNKSKLLYVKKCHIFVNDGTKLNMYLCINLTTINRITENISK
jgi:hypothetical protein